MCLIIRCIFYRQPTPNIRPEVQFNLARSLCTHREAPVDVRHPGVQAEAEDEQEDARHHAGAAADKLEEVDAAARGAHHDRLYADEADE